MLPWEDALASADSVITPLKVIALVLLAGWVLATAAGRPITPVGPAILWATGVGFAVGLSLLASPDLAIGLADASRYASFIVFAFLVVQLATTWDVLRAIVRVLVLSSTVAAAAGLVLGVAVPGDLRAGGPIERSQRLRVPAGGRPAPRRLAGRGRAANSAAVARRRPC